MAPAPVTRGRGAAPLLHAVVTQEFLAHQKHIGNDPVPRPMPQYRFPGLVPGDRWCVTAALAARLQGRRRRARRAGRTHERALAIVPLDALRQYSVDVPADLSALEE